MKITGQQPSQLNELTSGKTQGKEQQGRTERAGQESAGIKQINNEAAQTAHRIKQTLAAEPDVRPDRVEEVKERIRTGKYQVEPERLAESMLTASLKEDLDQP